MLTWTEADEASPHLVYASRGIPRQSRGRGHAAVQGESWQLCRAVGKDAGSRSQLVPRVQSLRVALVSVLVATSLLHLGHGRAMCQKFVSPKLVC